MIEEQITESIQTGAPSIKYEQGRDQIASMPDIDAELYQMFLEALKEGQLPPGTDFKTYKDMMMQIGQQQAEPGQGIMGNDRAMAAYGGLMGADGRKQYGIGSWFQKKIMDPIKNNPVVSAAAAALAYDQFGIKGTDLGGNKNVSGFIGDLFGKIPDSVKSTGTDILLGKKVGADGKPVEGTRTGGLLSSLSKAAIPIIGGGIAGLFSQDQEEENSISGGMGTGIGIQNVGKAANLLSPTEASAAGLRFSPELSTRKYSPAEMAVAYGNENIDPLATANLAHGGRIDYNRGGGVHDIFNQSDLNLLKANKYNPSEVATWKDKGKGLLSSLRTTGHAQGGRIGYDVGGLMDLGGMEKDYRDDGGFVPLGGKEKADDVPARLSKNEFVFTADAVRGAGEGDVDLGAEKLGGLMAVLEKKGRNSGAEEMFSVSERIGEVI